MTANFDRNSIDINNGYGGNNNNDVKTVIITI